MLVSREYLKSGLCAHSTSVGVLECLGAGVFECLSAGVFECLSV